jgi:hypothetical protein
VCTVTKRADLHPKANSKTGTETSALATVQPLALFGSPVLLAGEDDPAAYHELLDRSVEFRRRERLECDYGSAQRKSVRTAN